MFAHVRLCWSCRFAWKRCAAGAAGVALRARRCGGGAAGAARRARRGGRGAAGAKRAVVCLSRGGRNQPHTFKDTRPVPQVWGTPLFLENPAHDTGTISGDDNVFIKNQSSPRIVPVVFSFQVKHQRKSDRPETGLMHFWRFSGIMKSRCGLGLEHIRQA